MRRKRGPWWLCAEAVKCRQAPDVTCGRAFTLSAFSITIVSQLTLHFVEPSVLFLLDLAFNASDLGHFVFLGARGQGRNFRRWQNGRADQHDEFTSGLVL